MAIRLKQMVRALRLPFTTASALPFIFGSFLAPSPLDHAAFWLGLLAVVTAHLSANLINDYADSKSGADWHDRHSYGFFGGSKLIQEGVLTERFYLRFALLCAGISLAALLVLAVLAQSALILVLAIAVVVFSWAYSMKPLQLAYRRLGEFSIFILFGPVPVMGAYYLQTGIFPSLAAFIGSLAFGFFTTAILYANEVPDYETDLRAGKRNLVNAQPKERAYLGYYLLSVLGLAAVLLAVGSQTVSSVALLSLLAIPLMAKAAMILKRFVADKHHLMESSRLAIGVQTLVGVALVFGALVNIG